MRTVKRPLLIAASAIALACASSLSAQTKHKEIEQVVVHPKSTSPFELARLISHSQRRGNIEIREVDLSGWPDGKVHCPTCDSEKVSYLEAARLFKCYARHSRQKFSLKVGTIFEDSPVGLDKWLTAMWMVVNCKNGVSSYEIHRAIGVTQKTAWFMDHRIRVALGMGTSDKLSGQVEVDETFS